MSPDIASVLYLTKDAPNPRGIILAFSEAAILSFDGGRIHAVKYDQLEHINLTRDFLNIRSPF